MVTAVPVEFQIHDYQTGTDDDVEADDDNCNDVIKSRHSIYTSLISGDSSVKSK